jgi:hypothetical protein
MASIILKRGIACQRYIANPETCRYTIVPGEWHWRHNDWIAAQTGS